MIQILQLHLKIMLLLQDVYITYINNEHVETAENLDIIMPIPNLIEYIDSYADSSGSLWQFK